MIRKFLLPLFTLLIAGSALFAQSTVQVQSVELAIPFGAAPGKVVLVEDLLIFVDEQEPEASFAIRRAEIEDISVTEETITIQCQRPIHDRSGERARFNFRVVGDANPNFMTVWAQPGTAPATQPGEDEEAKEGVPGTYQVRHDHLIGGCEGRLIIREKTIAYESVGNVGHSRQWQLADIKEINRKNPYHLEVQPFDGGGYTFNLQRKGMDTRDYQALVDRIALARESQ